MLIKPVLRTTLLLIFAVAALLSAAPSAFAEQQSFRQWVSAFRQTALKKGITKQTFSRAFAGIHTPDPEVLQKASYQPEFTDPSWNYFDNRVNGRIIAQGQRNAQKWGKWLTKIESRFDTDKYILLGIWSMETGYGEIMGRNDIMRDAIRSLATLAYADPKRARFARTQLIAAMKILQNGDITRSHLRGSWAGALGHTQFIPTSYLAYAVDMDGDGKRDIWDSVPDALGSAANLLAKNGWQSGLRWGYEVRLPKNIGTFPTGEHSFAEWQKLDVQPVHNGHFPDTATQAVLKLPDGREGPAFLVTKNFFVIKHYNNSDRYALAVGLLADAISGRARLEQNWNYPFTPTTITEKTEIQRRLKILGFYSGAIDGKIGSGTRQAIDAFEKRKSMDPTGYPSQQVLQSLRKNSP